MKETNTRSGVWMPEWIAGAPPQKSSVVILLLRDGLCVGATYSPLEDEKFYPVKGNLYEKKKTGEIIPRWLTQENGLVFEHEIRAWLPAKFKKSPSVSASYESMPEGR